LNLTRSQKNQKYMIFFLHLNYIRIKKINHITQIIIMYALRIIK